MPNMGGSMIPNMGGSMMPNMGGSRVPTTGGQMPQGQFIGSIPITGSHMKGNPMMPSATGSMGSPAAGLGALPSMPGMYRLMDAYI